MKSHLFVLWKSRHSDDREVWAQAFLRHCHCTEQGQQEEEDGSFPLGQRILESEIERGFQALGYGGKLGTTGMVLFNNFKCILTSLLQFTCYNSPEKNEGFTNISSILLENF